MRQAGFLAAAGIYALDHHVERLNQDHLHAKVIAEAIQKLSFVKNIMPVETNIVIIELCEQEDENEFVAKLKDKGILCGTFGKQMVRFVTHLDINSKDVDFTLNVLNKFED